MADVIHAAGNTVILAATSTSGRTFAVSTIPVNTWRVQNCSSADVFVNISTGNAAVATVPTGNASTSSGNPGLMVNSNSTAFFGLSIDESPSMQTFASNVSVAANCEAGSGTIFVTPVVITQV